MGIGGQARLYTKGFSENGVHSFKQIFNGSCEIKKKKED